MAVIECGDLWVRDSWTGVIDARAEDYVVGYDRQIRGVFMNIGTGVFVGWCLVWSFIMGLREICLGVVLRVCFCECFWLRFCWTF